MRLVNDHGVRLVLVAAEVAVDADPVHLAAARTCCPCRPTGMLFSAWQATMQALQPVQALRSIVMPH
jgi:hypothetical protein